MLTREQKIDFLKCCISAYENNGVLSRIQYDYKFTCNLFVRGFCDMMRAYSFYILKVGYGEALFDNFNEFWVFICSKKEEFKSQWGSAYKFPLNMEGYKTRAKLARQFLNQEYGIDY